ncbi:hypothetical protein LTR28_013168, partial [Elasticomyces elasticus]
LSDAITLDGDIDLDDDENFIEFPHGEREDYAVDWPDRPLEEAYHNRHTRPPVIYGIQSRASGRQLFSLGRTTANQVRAALTRHSSDSHDASSSPSESGASNYFGYHDGGEQDDYEEAYGGSSLDGFIDDGEGDTQSENSDVSIAGSLQHNRQYPINERRRRVVHSVSDPSDAEAGDHTSGAPDGSGSDSDSDTNEEGPVSRGRSQIQVLEVVMKSLPMGTGRYKDVTIPLRYYPKGEEVRRRFLERLGKDGLEGPVNYYYTLRDNTMLEEERALCPETSEDGKDRRKIDVPVLYIGQTGDWVCRVDLMGDAVQKGLVSDLEEKVVQGGHWILYEKPDEIASIIGEWVQKRFPVSA